MLEHLIEINFDRKKETAMKIESHKVLAYARDTMLFLLPYKCAITRCKQILYVLTTVSIVSMLQLCGVHENDDYITFPTWHILYADSP